MPVANIVFGGSDAIRTVTITPALNQSGTATITITVTDADGGDRQRQLRPDRHARTTCRRFGAATRRPEEDTRERRDRPHGRRHSDDHRRDLATTPAASARDARADRSDCVSVPACRARCVHASTITLDAGVKPAATSPDRYTVIREGCATAGLDLRARHVIPERHGRTARQRRGQRRGRRRRTRRRPLLGFTVGDAGHGAAASPSTDRPRQPDAGAGGNIVFGGTDALRTFTITPAESERTATVTITGSRMATRDPAAIERRGPDGHSRERPPTISATSPTRRPPRTRRRPRSASRSATRKPGRGADRHGELVEPDPGADGQHRLRRQRTRAAPSRSPRRRIRAAPPPSRSP